MFNLFSLLKPNKITESEIAKPLMQKIYKSALVLYTTPIKKGAKIKIEKHSGVVQDLNLWYVKLKSSNKYTYIPTSFIYDKVFELSE